MTGNDLSGLLAGKALKELDWRALEDRALVEVVEVAEHPWFVACQFHPEFTSTPRGGHPLFKDFVEAALAYKADKA